MSIEFLWFYFHVEVYNYTFQRLWLFLPTSTLTKFSFPSRRTTLKEGYERQMKIHISYENLYLNCKEHASFSKNNKNLIQL